MLVIEAGSSSPSPFISQSHLVSFQCMICGQFSQSVNSNSIQTREQLMGSPISSDV
jgi:hypothetical protein